MRPQRHQAGDRASGEHSQDREVSARQGPPLVLGYRHISELAAPYLEAYLKSLLVYIEMLMLICQLNDQ